MKSTIGSAQQSRRAFLEKAARFAVYTPPVMMLLMHPGTEAIASGQTRPSGRPLHRPDRGRPRPNDRGRGRRGG